jgi:CSLREA domain-containing protein
MADSDTYVHPLMPSSPALDAGSCTDANGDPILFDQRGMSRPQGAACDIGAYEKAESVTITVNSTADDLTDNGNCTLREAVEAANTKSAVDMCPAGGLITTTIMVPAGTYTLTIPGDQENNNQTGDIDILSNVVLIGAGAEETILNANGLDRFLDVYDPGPCRHQPPDDYEWRLQQ